ncbi:MAG: DUF6266 family protein [Omnitrophica WOR_2 bacterium]
MAKRKPNGEYVGLVGNVVLYEANGQGIMRGRSKPRKDTSNLLAEERSSFGKITHFLSKIKTILNTGFQDYAPGKSSWNSALSVNYSAYREAVRLNTADSFAWLSIAHGNLSSAEMVDVSLDNNNKVVITWSGTEPGKVYHNNDIVMVLILKNGLKSLIHVNESNIRQDGTITLNPGALVANDKIDVFIAFCTSSYKKKSDKNVSNSQWIKQLTVV